MKYLTSLILSALLLSSSAFAEGFGFNVGPFDMQIDATGFYDEHDKKDLLDHPICYAIFNQKRLDMVVEGKEMVNSKEIKFITKRLIIEPYVFGMTQDEKPVLRGNVVSEKFIKEVTIRYGEDHFAESGKGSERKEKGFFSGWFKSDKSQNIDIETLSNLHVVNDSHFDVPEDYKGLKDDNIRVICQLPHAVDPASHNFKKPN